MGTKETLESQALRARLGAQAKSRTEVMGGKQLGVSDYEQRHRPKAHKA